MQVASALITNEEDEFSGRQVDCRLYLGARGTESRLQTAAFLIDTLMGLGIRMQLSAIGFRAPQV